MSFTIGKSNVFLTFLLVVCIIFCRLYILLLSNVYPLCISLIIPSTFDGLLKCSSILKRSICRSINHPNEIILVISGIISRNNNVIFSLSKHLKKCTNKLIIVYRRKKCNAASNRNIGYYYSHCSILSYFDVDDIMSIYRIYIIYKIFSENKNIDVVFHPSIRNKTKLDLQNLSELYNKYAVLNQYNEITKRCRDTFSFDNRIYKCDVSNNFFITNGWPSLKRKIMNNIHFNESLQSTEDLDFISKVVKNGYKVALFKKPLGFYIKDFNCRV